MRLEVERVEQEESGAAWKIPLIWMNLGHKIKCSIRFEPI